MALFGHAAIGATCPLLGAEPTFRLCRPRSAFDPTRTLGLGSYFLQEQPEVSGERRRDSGLNSEELQGCQPLRLFHEWGGTGANAVVC